MKAVIIGDVGWRYLYHLGDEAMTEAAIDQLTKRGVKDITLVAAEPHVANAMYGLPAVARVGFLGKWTRHKNERVIAEVTEELRSTNPTTDLAKAIRDCDVAIIAGGGNMNSDHVHHLYERVAFKRMAERFSKPLFVTSQTVGPMLRPGDAVYVKEIVDYAVSFGSRERTTYELVLGLANDASKVVLTADDASLLKSDDGALEWVRAAGLGERWIAGSFTAHQGTSGLSESEYVQNVAGLLDELASQHDASVALAPHVGSLDKSVIKGDQLRNQEIAAASRSGRVVALDMLTARQDVALIEGSILSVSTRYHPVVFAPIAAIPTAALSLSYYSSVRMRGALAHVGMSDYVIPATSWSVAGVSIHELIERADDVTARLRIGSESVRRYQELWWDSIVDGARSGAWRSPGNLSESEGLRPQGDWGAIVSEVTPVFELYGREKVWSKWFHEDRSILGKQVTEVVHKLDDSRNHAADLERRLIAVSEQRDQAQAAYERTMTQRLRRKIGRPKTLP